MEHNPNLICYKCGTTLTIDRKKMMGTCPECEAIVSLPKFYTLSEKDLDNPKILEQYQNAINKINQAIKFQNEYLFHYAFNTFERVNRINRGSKYNDYYPYWGKVLAQYGVVYRLNNKLEQVPVCLRNNLLPIYENENFLKALESADVATQVILKKEAALIDQNQKEFLENLINSKPVDLIICVDNTLDNLDREEDLLVAKEIEKIALKLKLNYRITSDDFSYPNQEKWHLGPAAALETADLMIVVSRNYQHLFNQNFKNMWYVFTKDQRIKNNLDDRLIILTDPSRCENELEINADLVIPVSDSQLLDKVETRLATNYQAIAKYNQEIVENETRYYYIEQLLHEQKFDIAKTEVERLINANGNDYALSRLNFLILKKCASEEEIITKVIDARRNNYYQSFYLLAPRAIKKHYYKYLELFLEKIETLEEVDPEYEKEVLKQQRKICIKKIFELSQYLISIFIYTLVSFLTISLGNLVSILIFLLATIIIYGLTFRVYMRNLNLGKLPEALKSEVDIIKYYHKIRKFLTPAQGAELLKNPYLKKMRLICHLAIGLCVLFTSTFILKEIVIRSQYKELTYYYQFNTVIITGGNAKHIIIPSQIGGRDVVEIRKNAFRNNRYLEEIDISHGVKYIGSLAFANCPNLVSVTLPVTLKKVGDLAPLTGCSNLKKLTLANSIFLNHSLNDISQILGENWQELMTKLNIAYIS